MNAQEVVAAERDPFAPARAVADAVLFEGYALYPYRPSATKNRLRWQFGVLLPRAASERTGSDPWWNETQLLIAPDGGGEPGVLRGQLRFLRLHRRRITSPAGAPLESIDVDGRLLVSWDEGEVCELPFEHALDLDESLRVFTLAGDETEEWVHDGAGGLVARVQRTRLPISVRLRLSLDPIAAARPCVRLRARLENLTPCEDPRAARDVHLGAATLGTHLMLHLSGGELLSQLDPPAWAESAARACKNVGTYPVLAGGEGRRDLVLSSPIILYDHPQVAPESAGDLFDATEIDEILTLRTQLLTDEEKRQARAADPRVAALIDRTDSLGQAAQERLHGTRRAVSPGAAGGMVQPGARVRLRPGTRRADAQDLFLDGKLATVREVKRDLDGRQCLAVTVDDDPAAELHEWYGRYHYFYADEIELLP